MIDLGPEHLDTIKAILRTHVPGIEVRAFGSRVEGKARHYSDLDLVVVGQRAVPGIVIEKLKDAFSGSDLPMMVDVLDWHTVGGSFQTILENSEYHIVQEPS